MYSASSSMMRIEASPCFGQRGQDQSGIPEQPGLRILKTVHLFTRHRVYAYIFNTFREIIN